MPLMLELNMFDTDGKGAWIRELLIGLAYSLLLFGLSVLLSCKFLEVQIEPFYSWAISGLIISPIICVFYLVFGSPSYFRGE